MQSAAGLPSSSAAAATTAAIHEFVCLFTHDLVRKQKRWQDGRLKYHTHNNRIVVHDDRGNSVGDHHWVSDYAFDEGEEFRLDRGSVIVQVNECVGTRLQDLSELVDKRAKERDERRSAALSKKPGMPRPPASGLPTPNRSLHQQSTFRPLQQVVGTPSGHHGRALIPTESPFEQRQKQASASNDDPSPPAKRRRQAPSPPSKKGYAHSLFGATLSLSSQPQSSAPLRVRHINTSAMRQEPPSTFPSSPPVEPEKPTPDVVEQAQHFRVPINPIATGSMSAQARGALPSLLSSRPQELPVSMARKKAQPRRLLIAQENQEDTPVERPKKARLASSGRRLVNLHETLDQDLIRGKQDTQISKDEEVIEIQSSNARDPEPALVTRKAKKREKTSKPAADIVAGKEIVEIESADEGILQPTMSSHKSKNREKKSNQPVATAEDNLPRVSEDGATEKPRPRQRKKTLQVLGEPSPTALSIEDEQPRTELRIKPRKKRGLLMLSRESSATPKTTKFKQTGPLGAAVAGDEQQETSQSSAHEPSRPPERSTVTKKRGASSRAKTTPFLQSEDDEPSVTNKDDETAINLKSIGAPDKVSTSTKKRLRKAVRSSAEVQAGSGDLPRLEEVPNNKRRKRAAQNSAEIEAGLSDTNDVLLDVPDADDMDVHWPSESASATGKLKSTSGPRLARFARKDIRSKEIIGFDFEDEDNVSNFNSFTAASFGTHIVGTATVAVAAPEPPVAEAVEMRSSAKRNENLDTAEDPSTTLPSAIRSNHDTMTISSPVTAPSKEVQDHQTSTSLSASDSSISPRMDQGIDEKPQASLQNVETDTKSSDVSAGQSDIVKNKVKQDVETGSVTRIDEPASSNPARSLKEQNAVPSPHNKRQSRNLETPTPEREYPTILAEDKGDEKVEGKDRETDVHSKDKESEIRPNVDKSQAPATEARTPTIEDASTSTYPQSQARTDGGCSRVTARGLDAVLQAHDQKRSPIAKAGRAQDENTAVVSQSDSDGEMGSKASKGVDEPVEEQATSLTGIDQRPRSGPTDEPKSNTEEEPIKESPAMSFAPQPTNRTFSRAKSMSTVETQTTKRHKVTLSRQNSATAKMAAGDAKALPLSAETTVADNRLSLVRQGSTAGTDANEDKSSISTARLANPATRGRKAAKPSDAAGQAPQCPLPPEGIMSTIGGLGRLRGTNARPFKSPATVPVSKTTPLSGPAPAFSTASGDPWSREAFDLFEYQRPS